MVPLYSNKFSLIVLYIRIMIRDNKDLNFTFKKYNLTNYFFIANKIFLFLLIYSFLIKL